MTMMRAFGLNKKNKAVEVVRKIEQNQDTLDSKVATGSDLKVVSSYTGTIFLLMTIIPSFPTLVRSRH